MKPQTLDDYAERMLAVLVYIQFQSVRPAPLGSG